MNGEHNRMKKGNEKIENSADKYARKIEQSKSETYLLRLYVTGSTPQSVRAIENIKKICEEHLKGRYELEVIDLYQKPNLANGEQIIAAPTLIKKLPQPLRRIIGDMSNTERVLVGLDLREVDEV